MCHASEWRGGQHQGDATPLTSNARALDPDASLHRLNQMPADIEPQPHSTHRPGHITLEADEFIEEQRNFSGWDTRSTILYPDVNLGNL